ncbi:restriction endonuclease subunit S [Collinsella sp. AF38-3AC]|uniref:restriction endonuclease subunit S n=1 Tax=Collinsella sp. AF38-3AC TaxID=2292015 RepID=UPI000E4A91A5|nr:restriction endonuclease subunit S [Collinsella sp. AF38-3AC]RHL25429.1 restriction endonuclease subunit S [Collinsella sp. AF38-3AC]
MNKIDTLVAELCPDGVEYETLGEIEDAEYLKLGRGKVISKKDIAGNPGNYPIYSASATNDGKMGEYGSYMFDDIRLTWSVDGGGKFFYRDSPRYSVTNVCGWLKVVDEHSFSPRFLYHLLSSQWSTMSFDYVTKAHPSVIRDLYMIPMVPLEIQREIVRILDTFTELTAELTARKQQYAHYRDQLLSKKTLEAMDGKSVEMKALGEVEDAGYIKLGRGKVISKKDITANPGNYPIYSASSTNDGKLGEYGSYMFDDIRLTWSVDGGGKFFYRDSPRYSVTNVCGWLKVLDDQFFNTRFLYHLLSSQWSTMSFDYMTKAHPSVIRILYQIPMISLATQQKAVDILDRFDALTTSLTDGIPAEIEARRQQYEYYRDRLLDFPRKAGAAL